MYSDQLKLKLCTVFTAVKGQINKNVTRSFTGKIVNADSKTANPACKIHVGDNGTYAKITSYLRKESPYKDFLIVDEKEKTSGTILIKWNENSASQAFLDKYEEKITIESNDSNESIPATIDGVAIFESFKNLVKQAGGRSGVHYKQLIHENPNEKNAEPIVSISNNTLAQTDRTGFFLLALELEPIVSLKSKSILKVTIQSNTKLNPQEYYKEFFPKREIVFKEIETEATQQLTPTSTKNIAEQLPVSSTVQQTSQQVLAIGTFFTQLCPADQLVFLKKYAPQVLPDETILRQTIEKEFEEKAGTQKEALIKILTEQLTSKLKDELRQEVRTDVKNEARNDLRILINKHLSDGYAVVKIGTSSTAMKNQKKQLVVTMETVDVDILLG